MPRTYNPLPKEDVEAYARASRAFYMRGNVKQAEYRKQWRLDNAEHVRSVQKAYDDSHVEQRQRNWQRTRFAKYGLTAEMFAEYLDAQEGCCGFCGNLLPTNTSKVAIDHDHETGLFRSITHIACNVAIAFGEAHLEGYLATYAGKVA